MPRIRYRLKPEDRALIVKIVDRMFAEDAEYRRGALRLEPSLDERVQYETSLATCHLNGCPLNLQALLDAPRSTFWHDVLGIHRHTCRETCQLLNHFLPRCARREPHPFDGLSLATQEEIA